MSRGAFFFDTIGYFVTDIVRSEEVQISHCFSERKTQ